MKIIYVYGDDDYAAVEWEGLSEAEQNGIIRDIKESKEKFKEFFPGCYAKLKEFKDVDQKFIDFLYMEILDYDHCKHKNFYIL